MNGEKYGIVGTCAKNSCISALIASGLAAVLILVLGAAVYMTGDPSSLVTAVSALVSAAAFISAGAIGALRGEGFWSGLCSGAILLLIFIAASLFFSSEQSIVPYAKMPYSLISRAAELALSAAGAFIAAKRSASRKKLAKPRMPKIRRK